MKFSLKFANYDGGSNIIVELQPTATLVELKQSILQNWPQRYDAVPTNTSSLRVVCMGRMLNEQDDKKTISASGFPTMEFPTPLHISVRPAVGKVPAPRPGK